MKTYKLHREDGRFFAFEIENIYIRRKQIVNLLRTINGVTDVKILKLIGSSVDVRVQFKFQNKAFIVWEPYGDNNRYWIGPELEDVTVDIIALECAFKNYQVPVFLRLFGDIITLNIRSLFNLNNERR